MGNPPTVRELIHLLGLDPEAIAGPADTAVRDPGPIDAGVPGGFTFCKSANEAGEALIRGSEASVIICPIGAEPGWARSGVTLVRVEDPRLTFIKALPHVVQPAPAPPGIHETAVCAQTARIDPSASVGAHCFVGADSVIGPETVLHPHVVVGDRVRIGSSTTVYAGSVLGADGFGYERGPDGAVYKFLHLGGVSIGDRVEIGANTCIDRGTLGDTVVEDDAKIDNLVHIAHNVRVGKRALVIALSMVGGSTDIDEDAWVAPGSVLRNGIEIGARSTVGLGAVVTKSVAPEAVVAGNPARPLPRT